MANMSYCKFQNTLNDLADCRGTLQEMVDGECEPLSDDELRAAKALVQECFDTVFLLAEDRSFEELKLSDIDGTDLLADAVDDAQAYADQVMTDGKEGE